MAILLYVVVGLAVLYVFLRQKSANGKSVPGPRGWPIAGTGLELTRDNIHTKLSEYASQFGDIFKMTVFGKKIVVLNTPELVKKAFNNDLYKKHMNDRPKLFAGQFIFHGSHGITFTKHVLESPHSSLRKGFIRAMNVYGVGREEFEYKVQTQIAALVKKIDNVGGKEFDLMSLFQHSLANIIIAVQGDHGLDDEETVKSLWGFDNEVNFFMNQQVDGLMLALPFLKYVPSTYKQRYDNMLFYRQKLIQKYFHDTKATYRPGVIRGLIDQLIAEQYKSQELGDTILFTDGRIINVMLETITAGLITTLSTLSSLFLCLMNHPEYQKQIQEEIDNVIGRDRLPSFSDKQKCPVIDAVILEILRYIPAAPLGLPHICRQNINFEGYDITEGSLIISNVWFIHHDEKIWGDPWTFRPERFLDGDGKLLPNDHPYRNCWLPFGTGRRQCVGESFARSRIFLFIATLFQRYTFSMDPEHLVPCDPRKGAFKFGVVCVPNHYKCKAVPRM